MEDRSLELIAALSERHERHAEFGYGIRTAADHVRGVIGCMNDELCSALKMRDAPEIDPKAVLKEAETRLVYANDEMGCEKTINDVDGWFKAASIERPPRTLSVVELIVTTPQEDRDRDILRTEGAVVDPMMPGLWHHMLPMPVAKMVQQLQHNSQRLKIAAAVIDSALGLDTMHLAEFGALRISHGFRPLKYKPRREKGNPDDERDGAATPPPGFEVLKFEIMEFSFVTVPSNPSAVITAFSRGKLHDPIVKSWAKGIADKRPCVVRGITLPGPDGKWEVTYKSAAGTEQPQEEKGTIPGNPSGGGGEGVEGEWSKPTLSEFTDKSWDDLSADEKRRIASHFAWYPNLETFDGLKLPHHFPNSGKPSLNGVRNAMSRAGQVQGIGGDIDRVAAHLRAHIPKEAEAEETKDAGDVPEPTKSGRVLSTKNKAALERASGHMTEADKLLKQVLESQREEEPEEPKIAQPSVQELFSQFIARSTEQDRDAALGKLAGAVERDKRAKRRRAFGKFFSRKR